MADTQTRISPYVPGRGRVMATDGGPHPAEAWAQVTAEQVAPVGPDVVGHRRIKALELQSKIATALETHHQGVQDAERSRLAADASHIMAAPDPTAHLDDAVAAIKAAAVGTEWEQHFGDPARLAAVRQVLGDHFATAQHIEKSWHADRNPLHPAAAEFRRQHHAPTGA